MTVETQGTQDSVGLVTPQLYRHQDPLTLKSGAVLPNYELVFETYGELNAARSNAILICHALSGHHHAAGYHDTEDGKPGWWDNCIGPGKAIDTNLFYVISLNNLGGCHGTTGPRSKNPRTGQVYGPEFPQVEVKDWVNSQVALADHLGIKKFAAIIGGSLGGMQALQWAIDFPDRLHAAVVIAAAAKLSAQNIAFNEIARQAILSDPNFFAGRYAENEAIPDRGLMLARMIGHVTYLSDDGMHAKFGREKQNAEESDQFQVESYLHHQGKTFSQVFDANTYVLMTKALDLFDPAQGVQDNLAHAFQDIQAKVLVTSFTSDWRFSVERSQEIVDALIAAGKNVASAVIESEHGHDSFLLPIPRYTELLKTYLERVHREVTA